jgi:hypothetical protein
VTNIKHHAGDANSDRAFHPLANLFPLLDGVEFEELVADIKVHGLIEPIILLDDQILDGRNRARACTAAGVKPIYRPFTGEDPGAFVISTNIRRRPLKNSGGNCLSRSRAAPEKSDRQIAKRLARPRPRRARKGSNWEAFWWKRGRHQGRSGARKEQRCGRARGTKGARQSSSRAADGWIALARSPASWRDWRAVPTGEAAAGKSRSQRDPH